MHHIKITIWRGFDSVSFW